MATTSDLKFSLHSSGKYYIVGAKDRATISGDVEIPSTYNNLPVTKIDYEAFKDASLITSVSIPNSITYIDSGAFNGCTGLTTVVIPDSVVTCSGMAFANCTSLTSVTLSDSTGVIGANWFLGCSSLTSIHIPKSIYYIVGTAFSGCDALSTITVDDENEYLYVEGNCCITKKYNSKNAVQAKTLALGCKTSVIPSDVLYIGQYAFYGCKELSEISIPSSVSEIKSSAFYNCTGLTSVVIPYGCSVMGYAFYGCSGIEYFKLEGKGTTIYGASILGNTTSLTEVCVNADATGWGDTWQGKPVVKESLYGLIYTVTSDGTAYSVRLKNKATTGEIIVSSSFSDLPVTEIEASGFINCASITSVMLPATITTVGENAFSGCSSLSYFKLLGDAPVENNGVFDDTPLLSMVYAYEGKGFGATWNGKSVSIDYTSLVFTLSSDKKYYSVKAKTTSISGSVVIPEQYNSLPVKVVEASAFSGCTGITAITLPSSVEAIGGDAFNGCSGLTDITLPTGLVSIGENAFLGCSELSAISIPDSVSVIGTYAFSGCSGLTSFIFPSSLTSISNYTLKNCTGLTSVTIPNSVTTIGGYSFLGCSGLNDILIPSSVTTIYGGAFKDCTGLISVVVPDSVTLLGGAFHGCTSLSSVKLPSGITVVGDAIFKNCTSLKEVKIPNSVTEIGAYAFEGCTSLKTITLSDGLEKININAFSGCTGISSVIIPSEVTFIGSSAFQGCSSLSYFRFNGNAISDLGALDSTGNLSCIYVRSTATGWGDTWGGKTIVVSDNVFALNDDGTSYSFSLDSGVVKTGSVVIPSVYNGMPVTSVAENAFSGQTGVSVVTIPNSITTILSSAFAGCTSLTSVTIPDSVTSIGSSAFSGCTSLSYFKFNGNSIDESENVLAGTTSLSYVYINEASTGWGDTWGGKPVAIEYTTLTFTLSSDGTYYSVKAKEKQIRGGVNIPAKYAGLPVKEIEAYAFSSQYYIESLTIPSSVTSIGRWAVAACKKISTIVIPDSVETIGDYAFAGCISLTSIKISNSLTEIPEAMLSGCIILESITIPESITSIGKEAFSYCDELTAMTIPHSVEKIWELAFSYCPKLTSFKFEGDFVTEYVQYPELDSFDVFKGTTSLDSVTINPFSSGFGDTWGGKPVVVENPVKLVENRINTAYLGNKRVRKWLKNF